MPGALGSGWIEGTELHFIAADGNEYKYVGTVISTPAGAKPSIWNEGSNVMYIDSVGTKRRIEMIQTTNLTATGAKVGSAWIEGQLLHWASQVGATVMKTYGHSDVAADYYNDTTYGDTAYNDTAYYNDNYTYNDSSYGDSTYRDSTYGDNYTYNDNYGYGDNYTYNNSTYYNATPYYNHSDGAHNDHADAANFHNDTTSVTYRDNYSYNDSTYGDNYAYNDNYGYGDNYSYYDVTSYGDNYTYGDNYQYGDNYSYYDNTSRHGDTAHADYPVLA